MKPRSVQTRQRRPYGSPWSKLTLRLAQLTASAFVAFATTVSTSAADKKPNIVVIFGDDIGMWNVGAYTHGMMGRTPEQI